MSAGIKPNELRIGNWIDDFGDGNGQVQGIDADGYVLTSANDVYQPHETFKPIPLTEDWILKFGFVLEDTDSFSEYFNKSFGKIKAYVGGGLGNVWFCSHFDWMCHEENITSKRGWCVGRRNTNKRYKGWNYDYSAEVEYVHQFQNLFFCLTGYDLVVPSAVGKV